MLQSYAKKYYKEIVELLAIVPSDLLLLLKTNDCLRHLDKVMKTPVNSTAVIGQICSDVILQEDIVDAWSHSQSWLAFLHQSYSAWMEFCNARSRVNALSYMTYVLTYLPSIQNWLYSSSSSSSSNNGDTEIVK